METRKKIFETEAFRHADQHDQFDVDILKLKTMERSWRTERAENEKKDVGAGASRHADQHGNLAFTWKSQGCNHETLSLLKQCFQLQTHKLGS